jgi:hypothetical protein
MPSLLVVHYETTTGQYYFQKVGSAQIADGAITSGLIASGVIGTVHLADGSVTSAKIASGFSTPPGDASVTSSKIASGQVGDAHIYPDSIISAKIASGIIGGVHVANQSLVSANFGANVIATPHIANQGILSASIGTGVVGDTLVADYGIISGKVASGAITEGGLASGISIDIAETSIEPSYRAGVPISGFLAIQFSVSGYYSFAQATDPDTMPAIGLTTAFVNSGDIGAFLYAGRITNTGWDFSGYVGNLLFVGTSSEVTLMVSGLMISGRCVQRFGKVAGVSTIHVKPDLTFAQIAE